MTEEPKEEVFKCKLCGRKGGRFVRGKKDPLVCVVCESGEAEADEFVCVACGKKVPEGYRDRPTSNVCFRCADKELPGNQPRPVSEHRDAGDELHELVEVGKGIKCALENIAYIGKAIINAIACSGFDHERFDDALAMMDGRPTRKQRAGANRELREKFEKMRKDAAENGPYKDSPD